MDELQHVPEEQSKRAPETVGRYEIPQASEGVTVQVGEDFKNQAVVMAVGGQKIGMSPHQARDLALLLRQAANRVDLMKSGKGKVK